MGRSYLVKKPGMVASLLNKASICLYKSFIYKAEVISFAYIMQKQHHNNHILLLVNNIVNSE